MPLMYTIEWDADGYLWDDLGVYWDGMDKSIRGIIGGKSKPKRRKDPHIDIAINSYLCYVNGDPYITGNTPEGNGNVIKIVGEIPSRNIETLAVQLASGQNTVNIKLLDLQVQYQKPPIIKAAPLVLYNR